MRRHSSGWTLAVVSAALFMVTLDNLVVTTALPSIRTDLGASIEDLEWTVNAYTLAFAVFLLTGAALGDRFGRRRMFVVGLGALHASSSAPPRSRPTTGDAHRRARALQGVGAAIVAPLTLTLLSEAFPARAPRHGARHLVGRVRPRRRARAARRRRGRRRHLVAVDLLAQRAGRPASSSRSPLRRLTESHGPARSSTCAALALARRRPARRRPTASCAATRSAGGRPEIVGSLAAGARCWPRSSPGSAARREPMLPMRFFRNRGVRGHQRRLAGDVRSGSSARSSCSPSSSRPCRGYSPLEAGPADAAVDGHADARRADRRAAVATGSASRPLMAAGLALQAIAITWLARGDASTTPYAELVLPFVLGGAGMALVFAPAANAVLRSVRPRRGRPGLGRDERDPRARRRHGRRRPRRGVHRATAATRARRRSSTASSRRCRSARPCCRRRARRAARPGLRASARG